MMLGDVMGGNGLRNDKEMEEVMFYVGRNGRKGIRYR